MKLLKQSNVKWVGVLTNVIYLTMPLFGIVAYAMSAATMYATVIIPYVKPHAEWLSFWAFALIILVVCIILMILFWKFVYLGYFSNPIKQDVEKIKRHLGIKDESDRDS